MPNNKKIGNQTGSADLPSRSAAFGSFVGNEVARFVSLGRWPAVVAGLFDDVGDYSFVVSSGVVTAVEDRYLQCYGDSFQSTLYPDLFSVIGTSYGSGSSSSTFNTPDFSPQYSYCKGSPVGPSGVHCSGVLPNHTHTITNVKSFAQFFGLGGNPPLPRPQGSGIFSSVDGSDYNNGRSKEVVPIIASIAGAPPVGSVLTFMLPISVSGLVDTLPPGVVVASGQDLSRTTYPVLFERLGTDYGVGDGSTTFTIPDLRGVFLHAPQDSVGKIQPNPYVAGSGYQESSFVRHFHTFNIAQPTGPTINEQSGGSSALPFLISPATSTSSFGNSEGRPPNFACLFCLVVSGAY